MQIKRLSIFLVFLFVLVSCSSWNNMFEQESSYDESSLSVAAQQARLEAIEARRQAEELARRAAEEEARLLREERMRIEAERQAAEERLKLEQMKEQNLAEDRTEAERKAAEELARKQAAAKKAREKRKQEELAEKEKEESVQAARKAKAEAAIKNKLAAEEAERREQERLARLSEEERAREEAEREARKRRAAIAAQEAEELAKMDAGNNTDLQEAEDAASLQAKAQADALAKARAAELEREQNREKYEAEEKARKEAEELARKAREAREAAARLKAEADARAAAEAAARAQPASVVVEDTSESRFTPLGGERAGNADGSIPEYTGKWYGVPPGLEFSKSGDPHPDPYANEDPLFVIHADNMDQYADKMSEGVKALMKKYPDTFVMYVYPSHRDFKPNDLVIARTQWNATRTQLVNGVDGLQNYTGGVPFPFPQSGAEVMWNGRFVHFYPILNGVMDEVATYLNGNQQMRRQLYQSEYPFSYDKNVVGEVDEAISVDAALVLVTVEKPERNKGQMTIVREAVDQVKNERQAWTYIPGSRRVRRAPTVGFDTPDGPGGVTTVDDALGFNGAMLRYKWNLVGKKEMYIPYNSFKFDDLTVSYDELLMPGHANPEYMRWELHRVWVVEAVLRPEYRHVYAKRRFYLDEDSWQIVLLESYDGRGYLWRVGILNTAYDFHIKAINDRAQMFHDLQTGVYMAARLFNETAPPRHDGVPKGEDFYTPANLRKMGR